MKKILLATDFSNNATDALAYAVNFTDGMDAHIHILHVVASNVTSSELPLVNAEIIKSNLATSTEEMKALVVFCNTLRKKSDKNIKVTTRTLVGSMSNIIKEEAQKIKADVIIMGNRGKGPGLIDKVLGSVSIATLSQAPCPVLLIPEDYKYSIIENVIYATNLNHGDPYELWRAHEVLKPHSCIIRCVYVVKDEKSKDQVFLEKFAEYMIEHSPSIQTTFHIEESDVIEDVLSEYSENFDAKMLIMHRSKKSIWSQLLKRRHTNKMARRIEIPLLVMNE